MNSTQSDDPYAIVIWKYVPPITIATGTVGHILTIIAVNGSNRRATSFGIYLTSLAVVDMLVLYTQAFYLWLQYTFEIIIKESVPLMCKLNYFCGFLFIHVSSWLVMCLTIERTLCMYFPHKVGQLPGPRVGLTVVGTIVAFLVALNAHVLYGRDFELRKNTTVCGFVDNNYKMFFYDYWSKTHFVIYFCVPITVICLGNTALVAKVYKSARSMSSTHSNMFRKRTRQVFLITLLVSIAFIVLVPPLPLLFFIAPVDVLQFTPALFYNMLFLNHAVNFFLYVLSGSRFREDLKESFKRLRARGDSDTMTAISSGNT